MTAIWTLKPREGLASLVMKKIPLQPLADNEIRVAIKANSLNSRDLMISNGNSPLPVADELIPLSDGAGDVVEIGNKVSDLKVGDRVVIAFNPAHLDGPYTPEMEPNALGGVANGLLTETAVLPSSAVVKLPDSISYQQAACLPCAGVVAWNALFEQSPLIPGQTVFATGTGTVSLIALCLAKAAGAKFGLSSSSDEKIRKAIALGADFGVNYHSEKSWTDATWQATDERGADIILENTGPPTIAASLRVAAQGGRIAQIGFKAADGPPIDVLDLMIKGVSVNPIMVGSRAMLQRLVHAVAVNKIQVPVDSIFSFTDVPAAFSAAAEGNAFGKIVISHT